MHISIRIGVPGLKGKSEDGSGPFLYKRRKCIARTLNGIEKFSVQDPRRARLSVKFWDDLKVVWCAPFLLCIIRWYNTNLCPGKSQRAISETKFFWKKKTLECKKAFCLRDRVFFLVVQVIMACLMMDGLLDLIKYGSRMPSRFRFVLELLVPYFS